MGGSRFALVLGFLLSSCATQLVQESELPKAPEEFQQKIVEAPAAAPVQGVPEKALPPKTEKPKTKKSKQNEVVKKIPTWTPEAWPYGFGEKFSMAIRWGVIEGGIATLNVGEPQMLNGEPVLHYFATVVSSKALNFFYKIDDRMDSWVGLSDHLPRRVEIKQNESGQWGRRVVIHDPVKNKAKYYAFITKKDGTQQEIRREDDTTEFAQDVFGALYFYRFISKLDSANFPVHDRWRNWNNELVFLGDEEINVPAGRFKTKHFRMLPRVSGQLEPKGDVEIWVKDDPSRILVQFTAKIKVGTVIGELRDYTPGRVIDIAVPTMRTPVNVMSAEKNGL